MRQETDTGVPCPYSMRGRRSGSISRAGSRGRRAECPREEPERSRGNVDAGNSFADRLGCRLGGRNFGEILRHDTGAFFYGDDFVDGDAGEAIDLAAGPSNLERIDFRALAQAEMNARV